LPRRFPPPWRVEELSESFVIRDAAGQALAFVYFFARRILAAQILNTGRQTRKPGREAGLLGPLISQQSRQAA